MVNYKCSCGTELEDIGIIKSSESNLYHYAYKCPECDKTYKDNPGQDSIKSLFNKPIYKKGIDLFEAFNFKPVDQMYRQSISVPSNRNPLVHLGKISGVLYVSDKEAKNKKDSKKTTYIHECNQPYPDFFVTADGKTFIVAGGKMHIPTKGKYKGWLVD